MFMVVWMSLCPSLCRTSFNVTPDYLVYGLKFDLKEITGNGKETLDKNTRKARKQAENIIFDVTKYPLTDKQIFIEAREEVWTELL